jgi:hypothetical protein
MPKKDNGGHGNANAMIARQSELIPYFDQIVEKPT